MTLEFVIESGPRPRVLQSLRELWAYRHTVLAFAERDIRLKYKQAVLGVAWAVIQPLATMVIFSIAFGKLAKVPGGGAPYPLFALSVLVPWMFLQGAVTFGANALLTDAALVRKVYFPREVPVIGAVLASWVDFGIGLILFAVLGTLLGARSSLAWLTIPLLGLVLALLATGVALVVAALNVYYRDFRYALPFAMQMWLFVSPVVYPLTLVPEHLRTLYIVFNPAAGVLDGFRAVLALGRLPDPGLLAVSLLGAAIVALAGYRIFKGLEPNFADVM